MRTHQEAVMPRRRGAAGLGRPSSWLSKYRAAAAAAAAAAVSFLHRHVNLFFNDRRC